MVFEFPIRLKLIEILNYLTDLDYLSFYLFLICS